jgi:hypothetical protein
VTAAGSFADRCRPDSKKAVAELDTSAGRHGAHVVPQYLLALAYFDFLYLTAAPVYDPDRRFLLFVSSGHCRLISLDRLSKPGRVHPARTQFLAEARHENATSAAASLVPLRSTRRAAPPATRGELKEVPETLA